MYEDQVVYGGNQFFGFPAVALGYRHVLHWDEAFDPGGFKQGPGLDFPAESCAHGKPLNWSF